jgi:predicted ester cyclase
MALSNVEVVRDMLHRQWNLHDIAAVDYIAIDHIDHNPTHGQGQGRAAIKEVIGAMLAAGDFSVEIHTVFGEGDMVASRYTVSAVLHGDFMGMPAAGKKTRSHVVGIDRVADGQLLESWGEYNALEMMEQLGLLPPGFPQSGL